MSSEFVDYITSLSHKKTFLEPMAGNNGDQLILMGMQHVLKQCNLNLVDRIEDAEQILVNGGGAINDIWQAGIDLLVRYRVTYPHLPMIVAPSSFKFGQDDFDRICSPSMAPLVLFSREKFSNDILTQLERPHFVELKTSRDLAFELESTNFIRDLRDRCQKDHILIAMRKDKEGAAGHLLVNAKGTWLPVCIRKPLSRIRDRLVAKRSSDTINEVLNEFGISKKSIRLYRDMSVSVSFDEFLDVISRSTLIITDRLHISILGYLLGKKVALKQGAYHKIRGVYELSMSDNTSRVKLLD